MPQIEIRQAQNDDAHRISDLLFQLGYETEPSKIEVLVSKSLCSDGNIYVGVRNGDVIAVISLIYFEYLSSAEKSCRITSIVVDKSIRGAGIGTVLIEHAKKRAIEEGCQIIEVTTSLLREQTQAYYESIGFSKSSYKYVQKLGNNI